MLKRFSVEGYRCFRDKVTLDLGKHHDYNWHNDPASGDGYLTNGIVSNALVLGANSTGKTNLGNALMDVKDNFRRSGVRALMDGEVDSTFVNGDLNERAVGFEYLFEISDTEVFYAYQKDESHRIVHECLRVDGALAYESDTKAGCLDTAGLGVLGTTTLNWDFSEDELSILGYLSNSIPRSQSPLVYELRKFIDGMEMVCVPTYTPRFVTMRGPLRRIAHDRELVGRFEQFLRENGVDERLVVIDSPEGEPVLYFDHRNPVRFDRACSSGTLTLLLLFARVFLGDGDSGATLVYIDEFDAYLHYEAAERLIRGLGSMGGCQTLCSTHNTSLLRNVTMRPDCVFRIAREGRERDGRPSGALVIRSLADSTSREIRRINNVEHLYRNGEFG